MPRKPRASAPGQSGGRYPNRSDMVEKQAQPVQAPKGRGYGERQQLEQQQQAVPMEDRKATQQQALQRAIEAAEADPRGAQAGAFAAPTARPDEPLTAGVNMGPGPGMEAMQFGGNPNDPLSMLRVLYQLYPYDEIRELLEKADERAYDEALTVPSQRDVASQMGTQGAAIATTPEAS